MGRARRLTWCLHHGRRAAGRWPVLPDPPRPLSVSTALAAGPTGPRGLPSSSIPLRAPPSEAEPPDGIPRPTGAESPPSRECAGRPSWTSNPRLSRTIPLEVNLVGVVRVAFTNHRHRRAAFRTREAPGRTSGWRKRHIEDRGDRWSPKLLVTRPDRAARARCTEEPRRGCPPRKPPGGVPRARSPAPSAAPSPALPLHRHP
jgi:hypothetical protein